MKSWKNLEPDVVKILPRHYTKGRAGRRINKVVIHHNGGNLTAQSIYDVWMVRPASAHYQVDDRGIISQHVWDRDTAWHAANLTANRTSIGIEHANIGSASTAIGQKTLEEGAHLTAAVCAYYGLGRPRWMVNVFPHRYFTSTACPGYLAGGQNSQYMARAQYWYDEMTGARPSVTSSVKGATVSAARTAKMAVQERTRPRPGQPKPFSLVAAMASVKTGVPRSHVRLIREWIGSPIQSGPWTTTDRTYYHRATGFYTPGRNSLTALAAKHGYEVR